MINRPISQPGVSEQFNFVSPASTSLDELVQLRGAAQALQRKVRKKSAAPISGGSVSRRLGRGLDFAEVREYQPGDDVRMIDWKVTARTGKTHTKLFVEERERPVLLVIDMRSAMCFGTRGMYKSVLAARLASLVGWCAVANRDRVGGFVFSDNSHTEIRPQAGRRGLMGLFQAINQTQQRDSVAGSEHLVRTMKRLRRSAPGGSTVVFLSDFQGFDDAAHLALGNVLHSVDMAAVHIYDPLDIALPPPGRYPLRAHLGESVDDRCVLTVGSTGDQRRYRERFLSRQSDLKSLLGRGDHYYTMACTSDPLLDTATRVVSRRAPQLEVI